MSVGVQRLRDEPERIRQGAVDKREDPSLVDLAIACAALYAFHLKGVWRPVYVVTAFLALYLNAFVGVVQAFDKIGALKALAPTGSEPPFLVAQLVVLASFVALGFLATKRFHPMLAQPA